MIVCFRKDICMVTTGSEFGCADVRFGRGPGGRCRKLLRSTPDVREAAHPILQSEPHMVLLFEGMYICQRPQVRNVLSGHCPNLVCSFIAPKVESPLPLIQNPE